eukprot:4016146-Pyramimonas_sp.AAC.1
MGTQPLGPSVELAVGPRNARGACVPKMVRWAHANARMGALGGAPCGATKRVEGGCRNWSGGRM